MVCWCVCWRISIIFNPNLTEQFFSIFLLKKKFLIFANISKQKIISNISSENYFAFLFSNWPNVFSFETEQNWMKFSDAKEIGVNINVDLLVNEREKYPLSWLAEEQRQAML